MRNIVRNVQDFLHYHATLFKSLLFFGGPIGRDASADTDAWMRAEILSYSRSRGLFAGVSLEGTTLRPDDVASALVYGLTIKAKEIVRGDNTAVPATGRELVDVLEKSAPRNESKQAVSNK